MDTVSNDFYFMEMNTRLQVHSLNSHTICYAKLNLFDAKQTSNEVPTHARLSTGILSIFLVNLCDGYNHAKPYAFCGLF